MTLSKRAHAQVGLDEYAPLKWCTGCRQMKPWIEFYKSKTGRFGLKSQCKVCHNKQLHEWRKKEPIKHLNIARKTREKLKTSALKRLGGVFCAICGYDDNISALEVDHIHDDGYLEKAGGSQLYNKIIKMMSDVEARERYQVLCANCNSIKRTEKRRRDAYARANLLRQRGAKI